MLNLNESELIILGVRIITFWPHDRWHALPYSNVLISIHEEKNFIWVSNLLAFYNLVGFQKVKKKRF